MNESGGPSNGLSNPSSDAEALCFRAWPCARCRQNFTAVGYLIHRQKTDRPIRSGSLDEKIARQVGWLREWIATCPHNSKEFPVVSLTEGSEHRVYLEQQFGVVVKCTLPGLYGDKYSVREGKMWQDACTPYEYLVRLRLWKKVFGFAPEALGIMENGQIVSVQEFVTGSLPKQNAVNEFLRQTGLVAVREEYWLWKMDDDVRPISIWVGDARSDNFVEHEGQIIPIDLRLWITSSRP